MCNTYEPPLPEDVEAPKQGKSVIASQYPNERKRSLLAYSKANGVSGELTVEVDPSAKEFAPNITLGELCVFIPGSPELHHITEVSVLSVHEFMPGVRVVVATNPANFEAYNRYDELEINRIYIYINISSAQVASRGTLVVHIKKNSFVSVNYA